MKIFKAKECNRAFFFGYVREPKVKVPFFPPMARGLFLHKAASKEFFYKRDTHKRFILNENGEPIPKYSSAEAYANAAGAGWAYDTRGGTYRKQEVKWEDKAERYWIKDDIKKICLALYPIKIKEGAPLYSELPFEFYLTQTRGDRTLKRIISGKIDEIRKNRTIRDYKFGVYIPKDITLQNDIQFTIYVLGIGNICYNHPDFALKFGVDAEEAKSWAGNPIFLSNTINIERFTMWYNWKELIKNNKIVKEKEIFIKLMQTKRFDAQFDELCDTLDDLESRLEKGMITKRAEDFATDRRSCDRCLFVEYCKKTSSQKNRGQIQLELFPILEEKSKVIIKQQKFSFKRKRKKTAF